MAPTRVFGWIAVSLSLVYKFPQIWKLYVTGDIQGISVEAQIVQAMAYFFYIAHGIIIEDPPIVFLGLTSLLQSIVLVTQYFYICCNKPEEDEGSDEDEQKGDNENLEEYEVELTRKEAE